MRRGGYPFAAEEPVMVERKDGSGGFAAKEPGCGGKMTFRWFYEERCGACLKEGSSRRVRRDFWNHDMARCCDAADPTVLRTGIHAALRNWQEVEAQPLSEDRCGRRVLLTVCGTGDPVARRNSLR